MVWIYRQDKWGFALDDVYVFNPSFFMDVRYGLAYRWGASGQFPPGLRPEPAGLLVATSCRNCRQKDVLNFPRVAVAPFTSLQGNAAVGNWGGTHPFPERQLHQAPGQAQRQVRPGYAATASRPTSTRST